MSSAKWLDGLSAKMPIEDAARDVLAVRFGAVHEHLPPALAASNHDDDHTSTDYKSHILGLRHG